MKASDYVLTMTEDELQASVVDRGRPLVSDLGPQPRSQSLGDDAEAQRHTEARPADENREAAPAGVEHGLGQQTCLADAAFAGEEHAARRARGRSMNDVP